MGKNHSSVWVWKRKLPCDISRIHNLFTVNVCPVTWKQWLCPKGMEVSGQGIFMEKTKTKGFILLYYFDFYWRLKIWYDLCLNIFIAHNSELITARKSSTTKNCSSTKLNPFQGLQKIFYVESKAKVVKIALALTLQS